MASILRRNKNFSVVFYEGEKRMRQQRWESGYTFLQAIERKSQIELEEEQGIKFHYRASSNRFQIIGIENEKASTSNGTLELRPFMQEFIELYGMKKWGGSYDSSCMQLLENYVYEYWNGILISDFTVKRIDAYYTWLITECKSAASKNNPIPKSKYVTPGVINDIHKLLRCAFNQAKKWQYIDSNPFSDATVPEVSLSERPALTPNQLEKILLYTDTPDNYDLYLVHCAINLAFAGSMRGGEIGGLQWDDSISEESRIIYIHKTIDRINKSLLGKTSKTKIFYEFPTYVSHTKTILVLKNTKEDGGSNRNCYLPEVVYRKLLHLKHLQDELKKKAIIDEYYDYNLIICQKSGSPITTEYLNRKFQSVLERLDIKPKHGGEKYVFHSLRATSTSYKLKVSGGDIKSVQGDNGQKNAKMVTHQYSRIIDEDRIKIAEMVNSNFYLKDEQVSGQ